MKYKEWFEMAKKDIRSTEILYEHDGDNGIICFHCQQAIEKYLKGFLIYAAGELLEGHNLVRLCKKAMAYNKDLGEFIKDMAFVNT
ncbi:HEPN domain-containing protein [Caldicoprobacter guelmensis]|uniref:HEPN domain-containing protein n=1 Tax=Caldicoprobacter guelmensis TaxID=1170224 RepID=UPI002434934A|nr:HEPN domain-containing protein [Caldicoprobacter guelmensis]MBM7582781.1 HEPN domain-containing protein [Caldicoprobacter guelmensis]